MSIFRQCLLFMQFHAQLSFSGDKAQIGDRVPGVDLCISFDTYSTATSVR